MSLLRFHALKKSLANKPIFFDSKKRRSELFGNNVFNENTMQKYLTTEAMQGVMNAIKRGKKIERGVADK